MRYVYWKAYPCCGLADPSLTRGKMECHFTLLAVNILFEVSLSYDVGRPRHYTLQALSIQVPMYGSHVGRP